MFPLVAPYTDHPRMGSQRVVHHLECVARGLRLWLPVKILARAAIGYEDHICNLQVYWWPTYLLHTSYLLQYMVLSTSDYACRLPGIHGWPLVGHLFLLCYSQQPACLACILFLASRCQGSLAHACTVAPVG